VNEATYFEIISGKTASLLAAACSAGAYSTSSDETIAETMRQFGEKVGIAFQIKDDLFDFGDEKVGKPTGNDIKEKKLTLPLIYTLNKCDHAKRKRIQYILKNEHKDKERISEVIEVVQNSGGIRYAENKMLAFRDEALGLLESFKEREVRSAMEELVRFTTDRAY
jgi:octaprenyl-diphosphate synthase